MELQKHSFHQYASKTDEEKMIAYLIRKLASSLMILVGVVFLIFMLFMLFPSAEEISAGQRSDEATKAAMRKEMGLDQSKGTQLLFYLKDLSPLIFTRSVHPDYKGIKLKMGSYFFVCKWPYLRKSYQSRKPVSEILQEAFLGSFVLSVAAMGIALFLGILFGIISALNPGSWLDKAGLAIATLGISLTSYFLAVINDWLIGFVWKE